MYIICMHEHEIVNQYDRAVIINNTCTISTQRMHASFASDYHLQTHLLQR